MYEYIYIYNLTYIFLYSISARKKNRELTIVSVAHTNIPPKEPVVYTKQTQTIQTSHTSHDGESLYSIFKLLHFVLFLSVNLKLYIAIYIKKF